MAKKEIGRSPTAHIPPFGLRLQPDLKERIEAAAKANGRSMNAEIVSRLEASFEGSFVSQLSPAQRVLVEMRAKERNMSEDQALAELIVAGQAHGAPAVIYLQVQPGTSPDTFMDAFLMARKHFPEATEVMVDHYPPNLKKVADARAKTRKPKA